MKNLILLLLLVSACNPDDPGANGTSADFYAGPAPEWTAQLNPDNTIILLHFPSVDDLTADLLVNGNVSYVDGFVSFAVTSSAGTTPPAEGSTGHALQLPGSLFVLSPFVGGDLVPMVAQGECPASALSENLVKVKAATSWSASTSDATATFTYDPTAGVATLPTRYGLSAPITSSLETLGAGTCADGIATTSSGDELFLTSGVSLLHTQPQGATTGDDEIYLALPQTSAPIVPTSLAGTYVGMMSGGIPLHVTLSASGTSVSGVARQDAVIASGTSTATIELSQSGAANGLVTGSITLSSTAQPIACAVQPSTTSTPTLIACAGVDDSGALLDLLLLGN